MATMRERLKEEAEAWGVGPAPAEAKRLSGLDFAVLWGDLGIGLLVLVTGALLVPALGLPQALLAIVVGSLAGCVPLALVGMAGAREGVPGMVLLRPTLGTRGSYLPTILNVGQLLGWTAFELWAMALVASRVAGGSFFVWLGIAAAVCLALSLGGPVVVVRRWMERFGVWVLGVVGTWLTIRVLATADLGALWSRAGAGGYPTFWQGLDLVIAMPVSWIPLVADYNRFARPGVSSGRGTYLGYLAANVWFYALGALLVLAAGASPSPAGVADAIATVAGGTVLLVALLVGETDEAFADVYSASVSAQNLAPRLPQRVGIVGVTAVGVAAASWLFGQPDEGVLTFESFLLLLGSVFVPLFAVFVADYFVLGRGRRFEPGALFDHRGPYRYAAGFRIPAVAAWVLGFVAFHWAAPSPFPAWQRFVGSTLGEAPFGGNLPGSVAAFVAAFVAMLALGLLSRPRGPAGER